jgi:hypothetical protein
MKRKNVWVLFKVENGRRKIEWDKFKKISWALIVKIFKKISAKIFLLSVKYDQRTNEAADF